MGKEINELWGSPHEGASQQPPLRVLFVSAEAAPFAKVGGLADVAAGLPKALVRQGTDCRVFLPAYQMILSDSLWKDGASAIHPLGDPFWVEMNPGTRRRCQLFTAFHDGLTYYFIGTDEWYPKAIDNSSLYQPGGELHAFFAASVFAAMEKIEWIPNVLHCNDWHTGFVPLLLKEKSNHLWKSTSSLFSIHNLAYQGEFGLEALDWLGLSHSLFNYHQVEAWGRVNFLKAGLAMSDGVTTVSPSYAEQIQTDEYGNGLDGMLRYLFDNQRLTGILNGIDTEVWDPNSDPHLASRYSADDLTGKRACKSDLLNRVGMEPLPGSMLMGMVSRLSSQKGFDLLLSAADSIFKNPVQLVVQGLGEEHLVQGLRALETKYPRQVRLVNVFDEDIASKVYGGSDAFLMPSHFEPCGLGQMIAMQYGTLPIVRSTGGLKDTVVAGRNGFTFEYRSSSALSEAISQATQGFADPEQWSAMQQNAMRADWSWTESAQKYTELYRMSMSRTRGIALR